MPKSIAQNLPYDAFLHPESSRELQRIVQEARAAGAQVRVRGALHSEHGSVLGDGYSRAGLPRPVVNVMLDRLTNVQVHGTSVVAGAGVSLGGDPHAIGVANVQAESARSLFQQLDDAGLALPITGGISHQTLGGFLSTGSAGGSLRHSFQDAVQRIDFVDGTGAERSLRRGDPHFPAALVGLGLLGIITEVELRCVPRYRILGFASTQSVDDCDFDLFAAPGAAARPSLVEFLARKEYARAMGWPQPGVDRIELWEAARYQPAAHDSIVGGGSLPSGAPTVSPLLQMLARWVFSVVMETTEPRAGEGRAVAPGPWGQLIEALTWPARGAFYAAKALHDQLAPWSPTRVESSDVRALGRDLARYLRGRREPPRVYPRETRAGRNSGPGFAASTPDEHLIAGLINTFIELTPRALSPWHDLDGFERHHAAHLFRDSWHTGLPMDNPVHDRLLPVTFTEVWVPMEHAATAMQRLRELFRSGRLAATGTFCIELYAAKASMAWLSPAHRVDVFRVDPFWLNDGDWEARERFFEQFWSTLADLDLRLHWAKALSRPGSRTGAAHRRRVLPELAQFVDVRASYDPDDVFLTRYWAEHLGIAPVSVEDPRGAENAQERVRLAM
jgi:hypothetical protein